MLKRLLMHDDEPMLNRQNKDFAAFERQRLHNVRESKEQAIIKRYEKITSHNLYLNKG